MKRMMLVSSLAVAALVLGLSMNRPAAAEQSTVEPGTVSLDVSEATPSSQVPDLEDDDSDLDSKRGRIGGAGHGMRPAMRPAARPAARPAGHIARPAGHVRPAGHIARPTGHVRPAGHIGRPAGHRPGHTRIAQHPGHPGHHPGHRIHHPGHHRPHPGHHIHHPRHRPPVVSWVAPGVIGGASLVGIEETECTVCPTTITRPIVQVVEPEETEVEQSEIETEEVEQGIEEEES